MRKIGSWISVILTLVISLLLIYYAYKLIIKVKDVLFSLPPELSTTIIAGASTILVSVLSVIIGKNYERKRVIENEIRKQKIPIYEDFIEFSFGVFIAQKEGQPEKTEKEMVKYFNDFTHKLIVWGSDDVIKAWSDFKQNTIKKRYNTPIEIMYGFEKTLLAIRKDTGHKNRGLNEGSLLRLFINDLDESKKE